MKKLLLSILCLMLVNFVFAQDTDTTKTKTTKTTKTITTTTVITTEDEIKPVKPVKAPKEEKNTDASEKKNIIKTNLTSFLLSTVHLNYERVINKNFTFQLGTYYTFFGSNTSGNNSGFPTFRGFGITPEIRLYPAGLAPAGFFVGLSPRFQRWTISDFGSSSEDTFTLFGTGVIVGGQWLISDMISIEVYGGPSVNAITRIKSTSNSQNNDTNGVSTFGLRFGVTVGYAF